MGSESSVKNRLYFNKKVTLLNAVATVMIILLHAKPMERFGLPLSIEYPAIYSIWVLTQTAVPLFFFVSGLLFYCNCDWSNLRSKLKRRITSLLIPYIIWNSFFVALMFVITHIDALGGFMKGQDILDSPSKVFWAVVTARCTSLWFVKDLMYFCLLSPLILWFMKTPSRAIFITTIAMIVPFIHQFGYEHCLNWLPMYLMGATIGRFSNYTKAVELKYKHVTGSAIVALFMCLFVTSLFNEEVIKYFRLISPILIWIGIDLFCRRTIIDYKQRDWMKYTFVIYCTQQFVLNVIEKIFVLTLPPTHATMLLTFIVSSFLAFLICYGTAKFLSMFKFYKYLSGGR